MRLPTLSVCFLRPPKFTQFSAFAFTRTEEGLRTSLCGVPREGRRVSAQAERERERDVRSARLCADSSLLRRAKAWKKHAREDGNRETVETASDRREGASDLQTMTEERHADSATAFSVSPRTFLPSQPLSFFCFLRVCGVCFLRLVLRFVGRGAYGLFCLEAGVHRVQRVPPTETRGRMQTSASAVSVLPRSKNLEKKGEEPSDTFPGGHPNPQTGAQMVLDV